MNREKKQLEFLNQNAPAINAEFLRNQKEGKQGYVQVYAAKDFSVQSLKFIEQKINPAEFIRIGETAAPKADEVVECVNVFFEVLWSDNFTKGKAVRTVVVQNGIPPKI